jgi:pimeloyl-ACP methyl ester carboxylesterase
MESEVGLEPRHASFQALGADGFHRVAYTEWGRAGNPRVLVCVHGLTRNGRDFDQLAAALSDDYRVICPDVVGRGRSDWLRDSGQYQYPQYLADMAALIARSGAEQVDWLGTSMGGLIGMLLAARPGSPIRRLVLNDVGPFLPLAAIGRIRRYVGSDPLFADIDDLETDLRRIYSGFGALSDSHWRHLARHSAREAPGGYRYAYDPGIAAGLASVDADIDLWPVWQAVRQPVLALRGGDSDILDGDTAERMCRGPMPVRLVEFAGVGHAPALMDAGQIDAVRDWLRSSG